MSTIKEAVEDILDKRQLTVDDVVDRHFAPSFRQRTNGSWDDSATFRARISELREVLEHTKVTVLDELIAADSYAERPIVEWVKRDGVRIVQEVYIFAKRDPDGRFACIEEATVLLER